MKWEDGRRSCNVIDIRGLGLTAVTPIMEEFNRAVCEAKREAASFLMGPDPAPPDAGAIDTPLPQQSTGNAVPDAIPPPPAKPR